MIRPAALVLASMLCLGPACRRDDEGSNVQTEGDGVEPQVRDLLVFPDELRVDDPSVNEFVEGAMATCASGDYSRFRLLWSVHQDPLPRDEYEEGWQAVRKIKIRAVEQVLLADQTELDLSGTETAYVIWADVSLDPTHRAGQREPRREVILMIIHEQEAWRLTRAPKALRNWVKEQIVPPEAPVNAAPQQPASPGNPD